jgi:hypothetical protein
MKAAPADIGSEAGTVSDLRQRHPLDIDVPRGQLIDGGMVSQDDDVTRSNLGDEPLIDHDEEGRLEILLHAVLFQPVVHTGEG